MTLFRRIGPWLALVMALVVSALHAQDISAPIEDEVRQRLRVNTEMSPLGQNPFGESVDLYNGTFSFEQTDIDLKGDGPDLKLTRSYTAIDTAAPFWREFVDWKMEIPHIETIVTPSESGFFISPTNGRCSSIASDGPNAISLPNNNGIPVQLDASAWWYGFHLVMPGEGSQDLILPGTQNTRPLPQVTLSNGQVVKAIMTTSKNWAIGCLPTTSNGTPGEGFLVIAPDGTQYWLDWLIYKRANDYGQAPDSITRNLAMMMVSHVVDRFGNSLVYSYDGNGNLQTVTASDGRSLTLTYGSYTIYPLPQLQNPDPGFRVATAVVEASDGTTRTWQYSYDTSSTGSGDLIGVTLPDGSAWSYNLEAFRVYGDAADLAMIDYDVPTKVCTYTLEPQNATTTVGTMTHPSGLVGTFTAKNTIRGESYVPYGCETSESNSYLEYRDVMSYTALVQKTFSGAGLSTPITWNYSYSAPNQSWTTDSCASNNSCASTIYTDVVDPNGNDARYTYSNRYDATESQLLDTTYYQGAAGSTIVQDIQTAYALSNNGPWPASLGRSVGGEDNTALVTSLTPSNQRAITQNGDTYTWQAVAFDQYAQATDVKRYNSIPGQTPIEETTTYLYDPTLWVLGLPEQVTNVATGEVESLDTYYPNDTLYTRARFGQTLMTYTFNPQGQLASFEDGNGQTTSLTNYHRGIPQSIGYPDNTSESLVVDDFGQISSITDQNGHTTGYTYNPVGRIASITYPTGDEVAWYPTTFQYNFVTTSADAARGIGAGHWDRTTSTGSAVTTTYFDAMLRPVLSDASIPGTDISTGTAYDWKGQTLFTSYPVSGAASLSTLLADPGTHHTYDALERVIQVQQDSELGMLTTSTTYLPSAGEQVTDPKSNVTTTYYQVFDEPSYSAPILVQAPNGISQIINRDVYGSPLSITQSGLYGSENDSITKTMVYDIYHRLCRTTEPESGDSSISYDGANNIRAAASGLALTESGCARDQVPSAATTTFTYDPMNRVKTILPPAGTQSTSYIYDFVGNLQWATSGLTVWNGTYNYRNMLTAEALNVVGQAAFGIGYSHDAYGHLSVVSYPGGGSNGGNQAMAYGPDALGRPTEVGSYASGITYWPNGQVAGFTYGNGTVYASSQNERQLLSNFSYTSAAAAGSTVQLSETMGYDPDANIKTVTDPTGGLRNKAFTYDGLNRLTSAVAPQLSINESYAYDALNNLRSRLTGGQTLTYYYNPLNQLANITNGANLIDTFGYDNRGNQTTKNGNTLQFDLKDQLTQILGYDSYAYDASGRRVLKTPTGGGAPVYSFYDHGGQLMFEFTPSASQATNFIYLGTRLIARNAYELLAAPGAVTFDSNPNNGNYMVSWGAVPVATSYVLGESANGGAWTVAYTGSATSFAFTNKAGGSYVYQVQACDSSSNTCGFWTTSATLGVTPALPTNVTVPSSLAAVPFTVSWTAPVGATSYTVQQSFNGGAWTTVGTGITTPSFSVTGNATGGLGGTYTYQISASNAYGTQGWVASPAVSVTQVPATPTNFAMSTANGSTVLTWDAMTWATSYKMTVSGSDGHLGTYTYVVGTNSFSFPAGTYTAQQLTACSLAGCSAPLQITGKFTIGGGGNVAVPAGPLVTKAKRLGADTPPPASAGCTATACTVTLGGNP